MKINRAIGLAVLVTTTPALFGQDGEAPVAPRPAGFDAELTAWQAAHGANWRALVDPTTGHLELLHGGNAQAPFVPDTAVDADWFALARYWVHKTEALHGVELAQLSDEKVTYLPLGMANGTDKLTVRLRQTVSGLPVESGVVNALFDTQGRLLSLHSTAAPLTGHIQVAPGVSGRAAVKNARAAFEAAHAVPALDLGAPLLQVGQVVLQGSREARLTYRVEVRNDAEPAAKAYVIDATNGAVLRVDELIHSFDVTGQIRSMATPGTEADHGGNPPTDLPMSYIQVHGSNGQTVTTDRDGNFNFPGVGTALDLTVEFNGTFNNVNNQAGSDYSITFTNVQPDSPTTLLMNPRPGQQRTAQANAYQHVSILRDYIRDTVPTDDTADFKATSNPNLSSTCNAYFNGNSVNYYLSGGGCNNTAFSSVVAHEMGHWLNVRYSTGNGSDGMGEGNADMFAMYTYDDPIVGRYFTTSGGYVRTGLNNRQFCGDSNPGCHGGVHADGEVWMGAGWKVRRNLKSTLGTALGGATADQLFLGWMNSYNQTQIRSIIEIQWLTLDDNDGDIGNGTPNFQDIDDAFREQGYPGYDLDLFDWSNVTDLPDVSSDVGPYTVSADVVSLLFGSVTGVDLSYAVNGGATQTVGMASGGGNTWAGDIPALGGLGVVEYWLTATDSGSNTETYPDGAPLQFTVGDETVLFSYDFEAGNDEGWEGHLPSDTATTGEWERGDPLATAAQPGDDHTPGAGNTDCWFTGQGSGGSVGENDVDNGITTLLSPVFDLAGASSVQVKYWRWYSNDEGAQPNSDVLLAQLSNDGGATWTTAETVGPTGAESSGDWFEGGFLADSVLPITSNLRVRFIAEDAPNQGSIVEAAIDDFEITALSPGCPVPANYCTPSANSTGAPAVMFGTGSLDVADNAFTLAAFPLPTDQFGLFFYGPNQANTPLGDGTICIGNGPVFRLPVVQSDAIGLAEFTLDFGALPVGGEIANGDTMNFSLWYRDVSGGPAGYNFSDGLQVTFCGN